MTLVVELATGESIEFDDVKSIDRIQELTKRQNFQHQFITGVKTNNNRIVYINPNQIVYVWSK